MSGKVRNLEQALQRIVALGGSDGADQAHVLSGPRRAILDVVRDQSEPVSVEDIAKHTTLHPNTIRHHLDVLAAAELLERSSATPSGRGRPRILYRATATASDPYTDLRAQLEAALDAYTGDQVVRDTARRWLASAPAVRTATDLDDAVGAVIESMRAVGFSAHTDEVAETIVMTDCPYASLIAEHPMICNLHAELASNVLEHTGQPLELEGFDVEVRPGVCRARLRRPDTAPHFVATPTHHPPSPKEPS